MNRKEENESRFCGRNATGGCSIVNCEHDMKLHTREEKVELE